MKLPSLRWLLCFCLLASSALAFGAKKVQLAPKYKEWLGMDAKYIISADEKDAFLRLPDDATRDKFIQDFWEARNPTPGAPNNPYKDDHYRRIAYANQYFGHETGTPGWRTEMGRIYIQLGEPAQKGMYLGYNKLRQMQIWFYQNANHALPPFFYVVFFRPDPSSDYKLYSPYMDGPEKLVTTDPGSRIESLNIIKAQAGDEVARTALSLLPDEPVDFINAQPSLTSDVMLATIRNLPNNDYTKREIQQRRELLESTSHRVIVGEEFLDALVVPLRDKEGNINLHYVLRLHRPEDFSLGESKDRRYYYTLDLTARLLTSDGKLIYTQERHTTDYVTPIQFEKVKHESLAYEGKLPITPGKYKVEFTLTDALKRTGYRAAREVRVPEPPQHGMVVSDVVAFASSAIQGPTGGIQGPFTLAGVKFDPMLGSQLDLAPGIDLKLFYQVWAPPADPNALQGKKLLVEYGYGRPGVRGDSKTIQDEIPRAQFDSSGSVANGKKISLTNAAPGNYHMSVTVTDPETQQKAYGSLAFRIVSTPEASDTWYVEDADLQKNANDGTDEYQRALCYQASGNKEQTAQWLQKALAKNQSNEPAISSLIDFYFDNQAYSEVASLYPRLSVNAGTDDRTVLEIAESLDKGGDLKKATEAVESALKVKSNSGLLYSRLASYYRRMGDGAKADELEKKGQALEHPPSS